MVDTQKSCRGLSYQEATDLVLGHFLEAWAKISYVEGSGVNDQAQFVANPVHFDNIDKSTCIVSVGTPESALPSFNDGQVKDFCGVNFNYAIKKLEKTDNTSPVSSELVIRHTGSFLETLGGRGNRSFVRNGVLVIKLLTNVQMGLTELYKCANIIAECFEGRQTNSSLWFQSVEINEGGVDGTSYQSEVIVAFEYDQVK